MARYRPGAQELPELKPRYIRPGSTLAGYIYLMFKAIKRIIGFLAFLLVILGALKSLFSWLANSTNDNHEVFTDEDHHVSATDKEEHEPQF